jgi:hypothetical protein
MPRQIAFCRLLLKGKHWLPIGLNANLREQDRSSPGGPVVFAFLVAVIAHGRIVEWTKNSSFHIQEVRPDDSLDPVNVMSAVEAVGAPIEDEEARASGAIGINQLLNARRICRERQRLSRALQGAAFDRAATQILDRLHGSRAVGVQLFMEPRTGI